MRNLSSSFRSLVEQRGRTVLSALGIMVATVAITLLVSIALGVKKDITQQVEDLGVNLLIVLPGKFVPGQFNPNLGGQSYLKASLAADLKRIPGIVRVTPFAFAGGGVQFGKKESYPMIIGATSEWFRMRKTVMRFGRTYDDPESTDRVAVIGSLASEELFGETVNPVGREIKVNGAFYKVIGVTEDSSKEPSLFSFGSFENVAYLPFHALAQQDSNLQVHRLICQSSPEVDPKLLIPSIEKTLSGSLKEQQYSVVTQEDLLNLVFKLMSILTWLLTGLTSIALFVGGVGIMAVMLMAVGERTKEIGVRKAVGARNTDIFGQFLWEAVLVSAMGGMVGLGFSWVACMVLRTYTPVRPTLTMGVVLLAVSVSLGVGVIFGLLPAMRAARRDPVVALRNE